MTTLKLESNGFKLEGKASEVRQSMASLSANFGSMTIKQFIELLKATNPSSKLTACPFGCGVGVSSVEDLDSHILQEHPAKNAILNAYAKKFVKSNGYLNAC